MATKSICKIEGCGKTHYGFGWCQMHYARHRKHGDPLISGNTARGEPSRFFRDVVLTYEGDECLFWPFGKNNGRARFCRKGRDEFVSRAVCEEINGPPPTPKHEAAHSCGKGHLGCVAKRHLSWKTPSGNQADRVKHGTSNRGSRQGRSKLTEADVREIRVLLAYERVGLIAERFGVTNGNIIAIRKGRSWAWLK